MWGLWPLVPVPDDRETEPMIEVAPYVPPPPEPARGAWCRRCRNYNLEAACTRVVDDKPTYVCCGCKQDGFSVLWGDKETA